MLNPPPSRNLTVLHYNLPRSAVLRIRPPPSGAPWARRQKGGTKDARYNKAKETTQAQNLLLGLSEASREHRVSDARERRVHTGADHRQRLQLLVTLRQAVDAAEAVAKAKLAAEGAQAPALLSLMAALVQFVKLSFSGSPDVLADFGLKPKKARTPMTAEQKAAANAKRKATREARGITTKAAKKAKTGNVVGVTITPVVAPVAANPSPAAVVTQPTAPNASPAPVSGTPSSWSPTHGS